LRVEPRRRTTTARYCRARGRPRELLRLPWPEEPLFAGHAPEAGGVSVAGSPRELLRHLSAPTAGLMNPGALGDDAGSAMRLLPSSPWSPSFVPPSSPPEDGGLLADMRGSAGASPRSAARWSLVIEPRPKRPPFLRARPLRFPTCRWSRRACRPSNRRMTERRGAAARRSVAPELPEPIPETDHAGADGADAQEVAVGQIQLVNLPCKRPGTACPLGFAGKLNDLTVIRGLFSRTQTSPPSAFLPLAPRST